MRVWSRKTEMVISCSTYSKNLYVFTLKYHSVYFLNCTTWGSKRKGWDKLWHERTTWVQLLFGLPFIPQAFNCELSALIFFKAQLKSKTFICNLGLLENPFTRINYQKLFRIVSCERLALGDRREETDLRQCRRVARVAVHFNAMWKWTRPQSKLHWPGSHVLTGKRQNSAGEP